MPIHNKKTKIVATLGPATSTKKVLNNMLKAGVNVFRINFSHANYKETKQTVCAIRALGTELGVHPSILGDLQGPKIRLGLVKNGVFVKKNDIIEITTKEIGEGDEKRVSINYLDFPKDVNANEKILVNDGQPVEFGQPLIVLK